MSSPRRSPFVRALIAFILAFVLASVAVVAFLGARFAELDALQFALPWALAGVALVPLILWRSIAATQRARGRGGVRRAAR